MTPPPVNPDQLSLNDDVAMDNLRATIRDLTSELVQMVNQVRGAIDGTGGSTGTGQQSSGKDSPAIVSARQQEGASDSSAPGLGPRDIMMSKEQAANSERYGIGDPSTLTKMEKNVLAVPNWGPVPNPISRVGGKQFYNEYLAPGNQQGIFETMGAGYGLYRGARAGLQGLSPLFPTTASSTGQSWGLPPGGDVQIGPFGFKNPLPFGPGASPASQEYYGNLWDAIKAGAGSGTSTSGSKMFQDTLEEAGWHGDIQNRMTDVYDRVSHDMGEGQLPAIPTMMSMMDQTIRQGTGSLSDFENVLRAIPEAARGANENIDEFAQHIDQMANTLQEQGLTYAQGTQAALSFSQVTNMSPLVGGQLMSNPFIQSNIMGKYGLLPEQQGLLFQDTGAFTDATLDTINQMRSVFKGSFEPQHIPIRDQQGNILGYNTLSARQQTSAEVAHQLNIPLGELQRLTANQRQERTQGMIHSATQNYDERLHHIYDHYHGASAAHQIDMLRHGEGKYGKNGAISWDEIVKLMRQPHSGFSHKEISEISHHTMPADRAKKIRDQIGSEGQKMPKNDQTRVSIDLTPAAHRLIKVVGITGQKALDKNSANAAHTRHNGRFTDSSGASGRPDASDLPMPTWNENDPLKDAW